MKPQQLQKYHLLTLVADIRFLSSGILQYLSCILSFKTFQITMDMKNIKDGNQKEKKKRKLSLSQAEISNDMLPEKQEKKCQKKLPMRPYLMRSDQLLYLHDPFSLESHSYGQLLTDPTPDSAEIILSEEDYFEDLEGICSESSLSPDTFESSSLGSYQVKPDMTESKNSDYEYQLVIEEMNEMTPEDAVSSDEKNNL